MCNSEQHKPNGIVGVQAPEMLTTIHLVSVPQIVATLKVIIRFLALANARIKLSSYFFCFAAWVAECQIEMELAGPEQPTDLDK